MPVHTRTTSTDSIPVETISTDNIPPNSSADLAAASSQLVDPITSLVTSMANLKTADPGIQAVLSSQVILIQSLMKNISNTEILTNSTSHAVSSLERKFSALEHASVDHVSTSAIVNLDQEVSDLKLHCASQSKVLALENDVNNLKTLIPSKTANFPSITDVTTLSPPLRPSFALASKSVKLKDLHNSLMNLKFTSDKIADIKHMYAMIRQAVDIGCSTSLLLPDIENASEVPDFFTILVPDPTHSFYSSILGSYKCISNALLTFFVRPESVTGSAPRVFQSISEVKSSSDGFVYLAIILHRLLPQFGGPPLNLLDEIKTLFPVNGEELQDFHNRAIALRNHLKLSKVSIPPTLFFDHYLAQLNKCQGLTPHLAEFNRNLAKHLREKGDSVPFHDTIADVYLHLIDSKCPTTLFCDEYNNSAIVPSANFGAKNQVVCELCDKPHNVDNCHLRGTAFMPPALARKVIRYNELNGSSPKIPKKDKLQAPFRPRHNQFKPKANMASGSVPAPDNAPIPSPDTISVSATSPPTQEDELPQIDDSPDNNGEISAPPAPNHGVTTIKPSCGRAEYHSNSEDYLNSIFPESKMVSVSLSDFPESTHKPPVPAIIETSPLPPPPVHTSSEQDILFSNNVLNHHQKIIKEFHVDWGSNIIISNSKSVFIEFKECNEAISPINGVPINGIKGYGTIIFLFANQMVPIRDVAYMPDNPQSTFTSSHIQRVNSYRAGIHSLHSSVKIINRNGISEKYIPKVRNGLDYIDMTIILPKPSKISTFTPTACKAQALSPHLIHQKCGHFFHGRVVELARRGLIDGLPSRIPKLNDDCPICLAAKATHHPRKPPADYTLLGPGQQLHADWCFLGVSSVRGHTSIFCIKCANTHKVWCIPCTTKRPPLEIVRFIYNFLAHQNIFILQLRVDEDGSLAKSSDFCQLLFQLGITLQTTGGYSSDLNGNVEILNKSVKRMSGSLLANSGLPFIYWCYAVVHAAALLNYLSLNHDKSKTAFEAWYGTKPHWDNFRIFGGDVYVVNDSGTKNDIEKAKRHRFLGWGASTSTIHYLETGSNIIKRARHVYFDDYSSSTSDQDLSPGAKIIRLEKYTNFQHQCELVHCSSPSPAISSISNKIDDVKHPDFSNEVLNFHLRPDPSPFLHNTIYEHTVNFASASIFPFGAHITYDEHFGLPFVKEFPSYSPWYVNLPAKFRRNIWILAIESTEPITASSAYDALLFHIKEKKNRVLHVILCKWEPTTRTRLEQIRATFDQFRSNEKLPGLKYPEGKYAIYSPIKPDTPCHFGDMLKNKFKIEWKKGLFEAYTKNARVGVFTSPFPIEDVPVGQRILESRVAFKVKEMSEKYMWDLYCRHCANGSVQVKGVDFFNSYAAIVTSDSIRVCVAFGASMNMNTYSLDIGNAFQNTLVPLLQRIYVRCPPFYIEWFEQTYPHHKLPPMKTCYVLQAVHAIQGSKTAGNEWSELSTQLFEQMGMAKNATDNAVFVFRFGEDVLFLLSNVDDFLILSTSFELYAQVRNKLRTMFEITTQEGLIINFLNLRIINSSNAISIDQTKHILEMVEPHFPRLQHFKRVKTPMRTDKAFEEEFFENSQPATSDELRKLEIEFGGSYLTLYGKLLHVATISRPQISNALSRLGRFQSMPNRFAFTCLHRIFQYLASYPNVPIVYPKQPLSTSSPIVSFHKKNKLDLPHCLTSFVDSNYATDLTDRRSVSSDVILLGSVIVSWKVHKDMSIASSSTDAETRAAFRSVRRVITLRLFFMHLGYPIASPTPLFEDNKGTHDLINSGRMTPRLKHIDVPLCYLHEKHRSGEFEVIECSTHLMLADGLNKSLSGNTLHHHSNIYTGRKYLPPKDSEHYRALTDHCPIS